MGALADVLGGAQQQEGVTALLSSKSWLGHAEPGAGVWHDNLQGCGMGGSPEGHTGECWLLMLFEG